MDEILLKELQNEVTKDHEIRPKSEINMEDCDQFWSDIFGKEISDEEPGGSKIDIDSEKAESKFDSILDKVNDFWSDIFSGPIESDEEETDQNTVENQDKYDGLTQEEKDIIKKETGWSDEIVDALRSMDEYRIYKEAGLVESEVNGKKCLIRTDIDWDQKDQFGYTNRERVAEGYAPLDKDGRPIQLHHIGQKADSPLAELTFREHRCGGNDTILHDKKKETEVHGEGNNWDNERQDYWKNRLADAGGDVDE